MELPKTLKIGAHVYSVICPYDFKERGDLAGQCDSALLEIRVDNRDLWSHKEKPISRIRQTLLHEILHAIDHASGLNELNNGSKEQERIVEAISEGLCQVFSDNPELLKVFKEG